MLPCSPTELSVQRTTQSLLTVRVGSREPGIYSQAGARIELVCFARGVDGMQRIEERRS